MRRVNQRGFTLMELIIAIVISVIALFGLAPLLIGGTVSFNTGKRRVEAGRDGELVLRALAHVARESSSFTINGPGDVTFVSPTSPCGIWRFQGGSGAPFGGQLSMTDGCPGSSVPLINGVRSQVMNFSVAPATVGNTRAVRVTIQVADQLRTTLGQRQNNETLQTDLYLRNAP